MTNKRFFVIVVCLLLMTSCKSTTNQISPDSTTLLTCETCDLVGEISRVKLEANMPFSKWFSSNYKNYKLNTQVINTLRDIPNKNFSFKIVLGTWCSDSQREVPRFVKILDSMNIAENSIDYYALDADKSSPKKIEDTYSISHVPTFIVYKNGIELNRIVEMSIRTLEEDLLTILTTNSYQHIYAD